MVRKQRKRRTRREPLVIQHLERVSRDFLERYPDLVRQFIGRNAGVYALYRKNKLYYVGLASALRHRLHAHGKNRHGNSWDHFSIYLTIKDQHIREIEALLLRIAKPPGAKQSGKLAQSKDMKRRIQAAIRAKQAEEIQALFAGKLRSKAEAIKVAGDPDLARLLPTGGRLRAVYKGEVYRATARRDGRVRYNGKIYSSISLAARAVIKRPASGWWFWHIERGKKNWVRLAVIKRAGTPIYTR